MAISFSHIKVLYDFRKEGKLPQGVSLMEFGEQNWYGDVHWSEIPGIAREVGLPEAEIETLRHELERIASTSDTNPHYLWEIGKLFYKAFLQYTDYTAIDLHGTESALRYDLNKPLPIKTQYDFVTNLGTSEHVFNQLAFFENMHNVTKPGGYMMHSVPNQGSYDHGFYNYHPTFVFDLAGANRYKAHTIVLTNNRKNPPDFHVLASREVYVQLAVEKKLSDYSGLTFLLQKPEDEAPFVIPQQGYYGNKLTPDLQKAWKSMQK